MSVKPMALFFRAGLLWLLLCLSGCSTYHETVRPAAVVGRGDRAGHKWKVGVTFDGTRLVGAHGPVVGPVHEIHEYRIYSNTLEGRVKVEDMAIVAGAKDIASPATIKHISGYIDFCEDQMEIAFKVPAAAPEQVRVPSPVDSKLNGRYVLWRSQADRGMDR